MEILVILIFVLIGYECYTLLSWLNSLHTLDKFTYESSVNTLLVFDTSFRIEKVVKYDMELFSYMSEELLKTSLWDLFSPDLVANLFDGYKGAIMEKQINELQLFFLEKGRVRECLVRFIPLKQDRIACLIQPLPLQQVTEVSHHEEYMELIPIELSASIPQSAI